MLERGDIEPPIERIIAVIHFEEERRGLVSAGTIVNDLLPRQGIKGLEANDLFDRLVKQGIVTLRNASNADRANSAAASAQLNASNPDVLSTIHSIERVKKFVPVAIRGEPLSESLTRERE